MPPGTLEALATTIDLRAFLARLLVAAVLGFAITAIYSVAYKPVGRQIRFVRLIPVLTIGMAVITSVLASSHALAIGMVGAMSWIRFRSVIEDPRNQVVLLASFGLGIASGLGSPLLGMIFLVVFGLVLFWDKRSVSKPLAKVTLTGFPGEVSSTLLLLSSKFPELQLHHCDLSSEQGEWVLLHPSLSDAEWLEMSGFLSLHLPMARYKIDKDA